MTDGPLIVSIVGSSGAGKTTVVEQLIPLLRAAGLRVGTVKHASHGHEVDKVGSDSWRHRRAGAEEVLLAGRDGAVLFLAPARQHDDVPSADRITELVETHLRSCDVVLAEGYAPLHDLLVEVRRAGVPDKVTNGAGRVWLTITDRPSVPDVEVGFADLSVVARGIIEKTRTNTIGT